MEIVSSVNVACGFHAGDPSIMASTVKTARERQLGLGAHPGLPDLMGFGRRTMAIDTAEMRNLLIYQLGALKGFASAEGYPVTHISYHAAFGNMALADRALADVLTSAIKAVDRDLVVFSMPDTEVERSARAAGLRTMQLFLADRAYRPDGSLVPRGMPGAVVTSAEAVAARVRRFLDEGTVETIEGGSSRARWFDLIPGTPGSRNLRAFARPSRSSGQRSCPRTFAE